MTTETDATAGNAAKHGFQAEVRELVERRAQLGLHVVQLGPGGQQVRRHCLVVARVGLLEAQLHALRGAQAGVLVSLGHSDASCEEARAALSAGARAFTHLFNAMSQLQNREPGMVGAALTDPSSYCGIIADGHHVHPLALQVALKTKPKGRLFLVTDAMPPAAGGPPRFSLQGREVIARNGRPEE